MGARFRVLNEKHQHQHQHQPRRVDLGRSSSSWRLSRRIQRNHQKLKQLWPRQHQPWWTPQRLAGCTSGFERASRLRHGGGRISWHRINRQDPLSIDGCGIEVLLIWSDTCLLFISVWPWHTSFRTAAAATTAKAGERTTRGRGLRRGCYGGREALSGQRRRAEAKSLPKKKKQKLSWLLENNKFQ